MTRRELLPALAAAASAPALIRAQSRIEIRGKEIVDASLAALGGPRFLAVNDRLEEGRAYSFNNERITGLARARIQTLYLPKPSPNKAGFFGQRERQSYARKAKDKEFNEAYYLYLEDKAYDVTYRGAKELEPLAVERFRMSTLLNVLYIFRMRLDEPGMIIEFQKSDVVNYQPVEIVNFTDSENRVVSVYFHQSTKFPVRQRFLRRNPHNKENDEEIMTFDKFRDVGGGAMWPYVITRARNGERVFELFTDHVQVNNGFPASQFELPKGIDLL